MNRVEMGEQTSEWKTQSSGIRQGCPLSPYLFLIIMTVMFAEVHADKTLEQELNKERIIGTLEHEILYADDTIFLSTCPKELQLRFSILETLAAKIGLAMNRDKTIVMLAKVIFP